jgi:hypothetical protein
MKLSRLTAIYTALGLAALLAGLIVVLLLRSSPVVDNLRRPYDAARATEHYTLAPAPGNTGNHRASNANAINRSQGGPPTAGPTPIVYPTLAPVEPLSQTVDGFTLMLYPVYADANRVVLTYTVQSLHALPGKLGMCEPLPGQVSDCPPYPPAPAGMSPSPILPPVAYDPQLTGADGGSRPWTPGPLWRDAQLGTPRGSVLVFDSQLSPEQLPAELRFHLTLNRAWMLVPQDDGVAVSRQVKGPFTFDFSMPVDPVRRVAEVNQTLITGRGHKITISRVIATRHHVRIFWRLGFSTQGVPTFPAGEPVPYMSYYYNCCSVRLEVGGKSVPLYTGLGSPTRGYSVADASFLDEQGDWTISTWYYSTWTGNRVEPDVRGPSFHFAMPPVTTGP